MSRRLQTIADLVLWVGPEGARVADIGTDHARLLPLLVRPTGARRGARFAIGIDRARPLDFARRTLARTSADVRAHIELRCCETWGEGLAPLKPGEVDTIVIAGMGARSIIAILAQHPDRLPPGTTLVLQPLTEIPLLRAWLDAHAIAITDERVVLESGRPRMVIAARTSGPT